jgi:hypothetical protein
MGMDLIGFILKGPRKFTDEQIKDAQAKVVEAFQYLRDNEDPDRVGSDNYEHSHWNDLEMYLGLPREGECLNARAKEVVEKFIDWWYEGDRSTCWIVDPDDGTKKIVFTGGESWGESPANEGYELCEIAYHAGFATRLGLNL